MLPLVALVVALAVAVSVALGSFTQRLVHRAEAQSAADAAALAGVVEGRSGAMDVAGRNGAELVGFSAAGSAIVVVVERRGVQATAAAELGSGVPSTAPNQTGP